MDPPEAVEPVPEPQEKPPDVKITKKKEKVPFKVIDWSSFQKHVFLSVNIFQLTIATVGFLVEIASKTVNRRKSNLTFYCIIWGHILYLIPAGLAINWTNGPTDYWICFTVMSLYIGTGVIAGLLIFACYIPALIATSRCHITTHGTSTDHAGELCGTFPIVSIWLEVSELVMSGAIIANAVIVVIIFLDVLNKQKTAREKKPSTTAITTETEVSPEQTSTAQEKVSTVQAKVSTPDGK